MHSLHSFELGLNPLPLAWLVTGGHADDLTVKVTEATRQTCRRIQAAAVETHCRLVSQREQCTWYRLELSEFELQFPTIVT